MNPEVLFAVVCLFTIISTCFLCCIIPVAQAASIPIDHFTISQYQSYTVSGAKFTNDVVVTAYDTNGNVKTDYTGSVYFTSSDPNAILPFVSYRTYTFTASDAGSHTFQASGFTFYSIGVQSLNLVEQNVFYTPATATPVNVTVCAKLVFTMYDGLSAPVDTGHVITSGNTTSQLIVQRQNGYANGVTSGWNNIYLQTTSPTGKFYYINGSQIQPYTPSNKHQASDVLPSILLPSGFTSISFRYTDTTAGNWTITAWSDGNAPYVPSEYNSSCSKTNTTYSDDTFSLKYGIGQPVQSAVTTVTVLPTAQSSAVTARVKFNSTQFQNCLVPQKYNVTVQLNNNGYLLVDDGLNNTVLDGNVIVQMTVTSKYWFSNGTFYSPWQSIEVYSPPSFLPEMYYNVTNYDSLGFPLFLDGKWHDSFSTPCYYIPPALSTGVQLTKVAFSYHVTLYSEVMGLGATSSSGDGTGLGVGMQLILYCYGPTLGDFTSEYTVYEAPAPPPTPTPTPTPTPAPSTSVTTEPTSIPTTNPTINPANQVTSTPTPTTNAEESPIPTPSIPEIPALIMTSIFLAVLFTLTLFKYKKGWTSKSRNYVYDNRTETK